MELDPTRTAIIAMHMQNDIVTAQGAMGDFFAAQVSARGIIDTVGTLLDAARSAGATVVYTRVAWQPGYLDMHANSPLLKMTVQGKSLVDGTSQAEIVNELAPQAGDVVVTHQRVSSFSASQLDTLLRARGIDTILFTGVATNVSVEGTARQASDLGYRTIVIPDACSTTDDAAHQASIGSLGLLAEIAATADVLVALGVPATTRETVMAGGGVGRPLQTSMRP